MPAAVLASTEPVEPLPTTSASSSSSKLTFAPSATSSQESSEGLGTRRRIGLKRELTPKPSMIFDGAEQHEDEQDSADEDDAGPSTLPEKKRKGSSTDVVGILASSPSESNDTTLLRPSNSHRRRPSSSTISSTTSSSSSSSSSSPVLDLGDLPPLRPGAWLGGASVAVLDLWGGLWHSVFGKGRPVGNGIRRNHHRRKKRRRSSRRGSSSRGDDATAATTTSETLDLKQKIHAGDTAGAAKDLVTAPREPDAEIDDLVDPVTRAAPDVPPSKDEAFVPSPPPPPTEPVTRTKLLPNPLSADLLLTPSSEKSSAGPFGPGKIATAGTDTDSQDSAGDRAGGGRKRSASILGFTRRTRAPSNASAPTAPSIGRPLPPVVTPFHLRKTLILDLDETLIHSTSRPMSMQSSGMGSGSGLVGINLAALFPGGQRRGGGGGRGEGHTVEVVLGGRSTLYHVYKRPYVDHFLKKVSTQVDVGDLELTQGSRSLRGTR